MESDRLRNALSFAVVCGFTLMLAGTSKSRNTASDPPPPAAKPLMPPSTSPSPNGPLHGSPDVDLTAVQALVGCPKSGHPACRLLTDFALGTAYNDPPASPNNVVWYGEITGLGGPGNMKKEYFFVQVEGTPEGTDASPRSLIPGNAKQTKEASDLVTALRNNKPLPQNGALTYIQTAGSTNMKRLMKSGGTSTEFEIELPRMTYMRRIGNRLLVLEYTGSSLGHGGNGAVSANGWIAETWVVSR